MGNNCGGGENMTITIEGDMLCPSYRSLINVLTNSGIPFRKITMTADSEEYKIFTEKHSDLELPVLQVGADRINSNVFAQIVYLSKIESKVRDRFYHDELDHAQMVKYGAWTENTLKPFLMKILNMFREDKDRS